LFVGILCSFFTLSLWGAVLIGAGKPSDTVPKLIRMVVLSVLGPIAALLTQLFISFKRVYSADEFATRLTDEKLLMGSLKKFYSEIRDKDHWVNPGHSHLFPVNVLGDDSLFNIHLSLFDTYPNIKKRSEKIQPRNLEQF
jgi:heat shock protein HtpX